MDEAIVILLDEAERMQTLASEVAIAEPYVEAQRAYLETAAMLLESFSTTSSDVYDNTIGLIPNPLDLPDWALPGEIQIKEAAGAAQINVETGEFGGRLSGNIALPKFDADLTLQNASFDSRGNIDISAYGTTSFPPDSAAPLTLSILPRRPVILSISEDGIFRAAGSLRLHLPDGNEFEAYFDADDPMYEFGFAYSGNLTLEMAKEVILLRPTIPPLLTLEQIDGFARFFGSVGKGFESFTDESSDLASMDILNVGVAPDFNEPEISVPLDVLDAWIIGVGNDQVRPELNGPLDDSLNEVGDLLRALKGEIQAARRGVTPSLNEIKRLRRHAVLNGKVLEILKRAEQEFNLGHAEEEEKLRNEASLVASQAEEIALEYLENLPDNASVVRLLGALEFYLDARALAASAIASDEAELSPTSLAIVQEKLLNAVETTLASFGFGPEAQILDTEKVDAFTPIDLRVLLLVILDIDGNRTLLDPEADSLANGPPVRPLALLEFQKMRTLYEREVAKGEEDLKGRARHAVRLADTAKFITEIGAELPESDEEFILIVLDDVAKNLKERRIFASFLDGATNQLKLEHDIAKRRSSVIVGKRAGDLRDLTERLEFDGLEQPFYQRWYGALTAAEENGVIDALLADEMELNFATVMSAVAEAQLERFSDGEAIEQNLNEAHQALLLMLDFISIAEDMLPEDSTVTDGIQQSWQPLHNSWVTVAAENRMHGHLSSYSLAIAAAAVPLWRRCAGRAFK